MVRASSKLLAYLPIVLSAALILFSHPARAQTSGYTIEKQKTVTDWDRACTYYNITYTGSATIPLNAFVNGSELSAVNWKSAKGKMDSYKWEWKVNESYEKPVYTRVCNPWNETAANGTNTTTITHPNCTRKLDHYETRYKTSWKEHPSIANLFGGGSQLVRLCGDVEVEETKNGWGYSIYHAINFNGNIYPKMTWWNTSWSYRKNVTLTGSYGGDMWKFWFNHEGHANSDCSDIRVVNSTGQIPRGQAGYPYEGAKENLFAIRNCNSTHVQILTRLPYWKLSKGETTDYQVYYGNPNAGFANSSWKGVFYRFQETFEDGDMDEYTTTQGNGGTIFADDTIQTEGTYSGNFTISGGANEIWLYFSKWQGGRPEIITFDHYSTSDDNNENDMIEYRNSTNQDTPGRSFGQIHWPNDEIHGFLTNDTFPSISATADTWYHSKGVLNWSSRDGDLYINGVNYYTDAPMDSTLDDLYGVCQGVGSLDGDTMWLDNYTTRFRVNPDSYVSIGPEQTLNKAPTYSNLIVDNPTTYDPNTPTKINATWMDDNDVKGFNVSFIELNYTGTPTNYSVTRLNTNVSHWEKVLGAGTYYYKFYANDSANLWNSTSKNTFTIEKAPVNIDIYFSNKTTTVKNQNITVWPSTEFNATAKINITATNQITDSLYNLSKNGTEVGTLLGDKIEYLSRLKPGKKYYFNSTWAGNENYTSFTRDPYVETIQWIDWIKTYKGATETDNFFAGDTASIKTSVTLPNDVKTDLDQMNTSLVNPLGTVKLDNRSTFLFYDYFDNDNFWDVTPGTRTGFGGSATSWSVTGDEWYQFSNSSEYKAISVENETEYFNLSAETKLNITSSTEDIVRLIFRYKDKDSWAAAYVSNYYSVFGIEEYINGTRYISETSKTVSLDTAYNLRVEVKGREARAYFGGLTVSKTLNESLSSSYAPYQAGLSADACTVEFDNFTIAGPNSSADFTNSTKFILSTNYTIPESTNSEGTWNATVYTINFDGDFSYNSTSFDASYVKPMIENIQTYDYDYTPTTTFNTGQKVIIRSNISDPQGRTDLDTVLINLTNPQGTQKVTQAQMSDVGNITNGNIYEFNYSKIPEEAASYGTWDIDIYANDTTANFTTDSTAFDVEKTWIMIYKSETGYEQWYDSDQPDNITYIKSVRVNDLDDDGKKEIIDFGRSHHSTDTNHFMLQIWNVTKKPGTLYNLSLNKEAEKYWMPMNNHSFGYSVDVYDLDDDGTKEMVLGGTSHNGTYNFAYLGIANYTDGAINMEENSTWITANGDTEIYGVRVWNRSGEPKIVFTGSAKNANDPIFTYIYNYTGGTLNYEDSNFWSLGYKGEGYVIRVADADDDGTEEIVTAGIVDGRGNGAGRRR